MSMFGLASMPLAFLVPGSSDVYGRRPAVIAMAAVASLLPLSLLLIEGPVWPLFVLFALGAGAGGIFPIVMAAIPAETVPANQLATVLGLTMGLGEILGGVLSPAIAGWVADGYGLRATLWILVGLSATLCALACALKETAPAVLRAQTGMGLPSTN